MATKRPAPTVHPSRHEQVPDEPRQKRQKPDNLGRKSFKKAYTVNEIKSQIRSLKRLLEHSEGLPADVRVEKERALQSAQYELSRTQKAKTKSEMIGRYHKIRFFDRQKATKRLKRAKKELNACVRGTKEEKATLQRKVDDAEVDVNYAQFYPLDVAYVALFPSKKKDKEDDGEEGAEVERKGDPVMWERVKSCMTSKTLDDLRSGRLTKAAAEPEREAVLLDISRQKRAKSEKAGQGKKSQGHANEEDEEDSDGGFFE